MRLPIVVIALVLGSAGMAFAQASEADGPVATAKGAAFPSTQAQIDSYLAGSPPLTRQAAGPGDADSPLFEDDNRIHGEVSLSIGTGGYRSGSVAAVIPLPRDGTLALEYSQTKSDRGYGYGYGPGYGADFDSREDLSPFGGDCSPAMTGAGVAQPQWIGRPRGASSSCPMR